ncbi:MAG: hypothetical protein AAGA25_13290 [Planctomycetota bacterium]
MTTVKTECDAEAKWMALVNDGGVPLPQRKIAVSVLKSQSGVADEFVLVRDHNSPNDVVLDEDQEIDLADGNVFYSLKRCEVQPRERCSAAAKLAVFINDRPEVTLRSEQTATQLLQLFSLPKHMKLVRDFESPNDEVFAPEDAVRFTDGPVFVTREVEGQLKITVNSRIFTEDDGVKPEMTGLQIAALVFPDDPSKTRVWRKSGVDLQIGPHEKVSIEDCEVFDVVREGVTGGFEASRVELETNTLIAGGARVSVTTKPAAVIYHELAVKPGLPVATTDVLVVIPGGYPGQMIDGAYLPDDSPLFGLVKGSPQSNRLTALDTAWRLVSYHPHTNGVGPAWDPSRYGFHTYLGEVMSWLQDTN